MSDIADHFYLATFGDYLHTNTLGTEPVRRRFYNIQSGPYRNVMDAWDGGWLNDWQWDTAVVLGFKGCDAIEAYHTIMDSEPTPFSLDKEAAEEALYESNSHK